MIHDGGERDFAVEIEQEGVAQAGREEGCAAINRNRGGLGSLVDSCDIELESIGANGRGILQAGGLRLLAIRRCGEAAAQHVALAQEAVAECTCIDPSGIDDARLPAVIADSETVLLFLDIQDEIDGARFRRHLQARCDLGAFGAPGKGNAALIGGARCGCLVENGFEVAAQAWRHDLFAGADGHDVGNPAFRDEDIDNAVGQILLRDGDRKEGDVGFRIGGRHGGGQLLECFRIGGLADKGLGRLGDAGRHFGALELYARNRGRLVGVRSDARDSML